MANKEKVRSPKKGYESPYTDIALVQLKNGQWVRKYLKGNKVVKKEVLEEL